MTEHSMSMVFSDDGSIFLRAEIAEGEFVAKPILTAEEAKAVHDEPRPKWYVTTMVEPEASYPDGRFDGVPPLYGSEGFKAPPVGTVILTADEWAAISVASRMYSYADGVDEVTKLAHKHVRSILAGLMERKP